METKRLILDLFPDKVVAASPASPGGLWAVPSDLLFLCPWWHSKASAKAGAASQLPGPSQALALVGGRSTGLGVSCQAASPPCRL